MDGLWWYLNLVAIWVLQVLVSCFIVLCEVSDSCVLSVDNGND